VAIDIDGILDAVVSHAMATGYFQSVGEYESKQSNTSGITASVWVERVTPIRSSGLASASIRLELSIRMYAGTSAEPYDDIDSNLVKAMDALLTNYIGDFDLFGEARNIDIFGAHGRPLEAETGYINLDGREFRVVQIRLPIVVSDVWDEAA
jgi:hypothetical protein